MLIAIGINKRYVSGSTSSGSVADDSENAALKTCCFVSCSYGEASVCDEKNVSKLYLLSFCISYYTNTKAVVLYFCLCFLY